MKSALERAAGLLGRARFPVFSGLFTDIHGATAALAGPGAIADIAVYTEQKNKTAMFAAADLVFKLGALVVRDGKVVRVMWGRCYHVEPRFDAQIKRRVSAFYDRYYGADPSWFGVTEAITHRPDRFATVPCLN